jgi:cysteine synthase A
MQPDWDRHRGLSDEILDTIGETPLLLLRRTSNEVNADICGKLEWWSPTGSLKDRVYKHMMLQAIERGDLHEGMEIIESSTGNAGISCAFAGRLLGYPVTIVIPKGMSHERMAMIRAYGAKIVNTRGGESDVDLCLAKVAEIMAERPGHYWEPAQFSNPDNVSAHEAATGPELWEQTNGKMDAFVATQGTGGTITGVGRFVRKHNPDVLLFAVEPAEAPLLSEGRWGSHRIEGIGDGFVPRNLDLSLLSGVITTTSEEAIETAKRLSRDEGLFCGISSGSNVAACLKLARAHPELKTIVTMINDSGQRYFSTALCDAEKQLDVPEREHPMDDHTRDNLRKYRPNWEIIT